MKSSTNFLIYFLRLLKYSYFFRFFKGQNDILTIVAKKYIKPGNTVLDIGANYGGSTLLFSALVGPRGYVHSFEPNPAWFNNLTKLYKYNFFRNICIHFVGLSNVSNLEKKFYIDQREGAQASTYDFENTTHERVLNNVQYIESFCAVKKMDDLFFCNVNFIKIDVEGHEYEVLEGGINTITKHRPIIIFEFFINDLNVDLRCRKEKMVHFFNKLNYQLTIVDIFFPFKLDNLELKTLDLYDQCTVNTYTGCEVLAVPK